MTSLNGQEAKSHNLKVPLHGTLKVEHKLFGAAGANYMTTFYINHQPVSSESGSARKASIKKGEVTVLAADLDLALLPDFSTFYAISVPRNASDYPDADIPVLKSQSVLLFKDSSMSSESGNIVGFAEPGEQPKEETRSSATSGKTLEGAAWRIDASQIQGKIRGIYYSSLKNMVIVSADSTFLFDLAAGKAATQAELEEAEICAWHNIKDGYAVIRAKPRVGGNFGLSELPGYALDFLDSGLKKTSSIDLDSLLDDGERIMSEESVSVSQDGRLIAFGTNKGLLSFDRESGNKIKLMDYAADGIAKRKGITIIEQLAFVGDDKAIAFKAQSFSVPAVLGERSFDTVGKIGLDGLNLENEKMAESDEPKLASYGLSVQRPKGAVFGSNGGKYFGVSEMAGEKIDVRVYDASTGAVAFEKVIKENARNMERDPLIRILDESRTLVMLLGNRQDDIETIVLTERF
jgi:hypothetical protein